MEIEDKDLRRRHGEKYFEVYNANLAPSEDLDNNLVCPSCDFNVFYINHPLSIKGSFNKVILHMLNKHSKRSS